VSETLQIDIYCDAESLEAIVIERYRDSASAVAAERRAEGDMQVARSACSSPSRLSRCSSSVDMGRVATGSVTPGARPIAMPRDGTGRTIIGAGSVGKSQPLSASGHGAVGWIVVRSSDPARVVPPVEGDEPYIADMADIILGLLAILAGGVMLLAGRLVLRFVLPIWGFFAGFAFGAGLVAELADERVLGTVLGWILGLICALLFAVFAYLYFAVAVILAMTAFGFAIGSGVVVALGIDWNWLAVLVGVGVGAVIGLLSVITNMPMIVLVVFSSIAGAVGVVAGLMLLVGSLDSADFTRGAFTDAVQDSWGWYLTLLVLAFAGIFAQAMQRLMMRRTIEEVWYVESR
jgi:hypothetical protein